MPLNTPTGVARPVLPGVWAFAPNRATLGGTAYFIVENTQRVLVDCPAALPPQLDFLRAQGGVDTLVISHRGGIGEAKKLQAEFSCQILVQEQEAYQLSGMQCTTFQAAFQLSEGLRMIWTPGHSPGASCLYWSAQGGILFTGRHLLPDSQGRPVPLKTSKTFHWPRQLNSVRHLLQEFSPATLRYICPGANTGLLRGKRVIEEAYAQLAALNLDQQI
ncbi:MBL fold metallo-hydrolase [Leptolyngbya sp. FACHB-261]|nr:MBL fold metallo-hydrolase [Leptolyngbya sp. FACHB-261]